MRSLRWALWLWACLGTASCTRSHPEAGDSSTHWLHRCGSDDQCGGLSCVCGVCSNECSATDQCAGLGPAAVCTPAAAPACGTSGASVARLCDQICANDRECATGFSCVEQRCRRASPAETDAGSAETLDGEALASEAGAATGDGATSNPGRAPNTLAFLCEPQRAESSGDECVQIDGYAWNGAGCEPIVCGCTGQDCAEVAPTRSECEAKFASCQPSTMCSGLPWYRCVDFCPAHWVLTGGGRNFGACEGGQCSFELSMHPAIVLDVGGCVQLDASLTIRNDDDGSMRVVHLELTEAAWREAALFSLALEGAQLDPTQPCTQDCVKRSQVWFERGSVGQPERFTYEAGEVPEGLRAVNSFIQRLIDQAKECRGDLLLRCGTSSPASAPRCGVDFAIADTSCACPVTSAQSLPTLDGTACSASCGTCLLGTCGATCMQPCAGGQPVWDTYCTE